MPRATSCSAAYERWRGERTTRLRRLFEAHAAVQGSGAGRRVRTQQINWALVLLLAAEFQGFARDLHDQATSRFAVLGCNGDPQIEAILISRFGRDRQLDSGNAHPGSLGNDFGFLGIELWPALTRRWPNSKPRWHTNLAALNEARNALAHSVDGKIRALDLQTRTIKRWWHSLDTLSGKLDDVVTAELKTLFNVSDPWAPTGGRP